MIVSLEQQVPSLKRVLHGLPTEYQVLLVERYHRILPIRRMLLHPSDVHERNRTWPGVKPKGKEATRYLTVRWARQARRTIQSYATQSSEDADLLWQLCRAYFRYGPLGLIEPVPAKLPPLIPDELQECADFHRLAKHPRSDAGIYIRELLNEYADKLGYQRLPPFVARYAWATDRKIERWFFGENAQTEAIPKTTRRLNLDHSYPHQRRLVRMAPLPIVCILTRRHPVEIAPWIVWIVDQVTTTLMGFRICQTRPTPQDAWLTFRWSIWHDDAPWWKSRGVPDEVIVPNELAALNNDAQRALIYTRTRVRYTPVPDVLNTALSADDTTGLPANVIAWLFSQAHGLTAPRRGLTLTEIQMTLLELIQEAWQDTVVAHATPIAFVEQGCSLPWRTGIASALLMPSAGHHVVRDSRIVPQGIPYDLAETGIVNGSVVDVRYDPADARHVLVIYNGAHVVRAPACAFEHRMSWADLSK